MIAHTAIAPVSNTRALDAALDPESRAYVQEARERFKLHRGGGSRAEFVARSGTAVVGVLSLYQPASDPKLAYVSGTTVPPARRQGHAARALRQLCDRAAASDGVTRFEAWPEAGNLGARGTLASAGFVPICTRSGAVLYRRTVRHNN